MRPQNDPRQPMVVLLWQEGEALPTPRRDRQCDADRMERANPDLGRWLKGLAQRSGLRAFWRWWLSELAPLMPAGMRTALRRRRLHPIVAIERDACGALGASRRERRARIRRGRANSAAGRSRGSRAGRACGDRRVAACQRRHDDRDARRDRASARARCCASRSRFPRPSRRICIRRSHTTSTGTRRSRRTKCISTRSSSGRDAARKEIRVDLAAALKTFVDQARRRVESWGAAVVARHPRVPVGCRGARGDHAEPPACRTERPDTSRWRRWQTWVPLVGHRARRTGRHRAADLAEARLRDRARAARRPGESAGRRVERAARRARAAHRRLQLRVAAQVRVPGRAAGRRGRHQAAARRHVAHAVRDEDDGARQGRAPRDRAARRKRERGTPRFAARGLEGVRAGGAALADDEDPARARARSSTSAPNSRHCRCRRPLRSPRSRRAPSPRRPPRRRPAAPGAALAPAAGKANAPAPGAKASEPASGAQGDRTRGRREERTRAGRPREGRGTRRGAGRESTAANPPGNGVVARGARRRAPLPRPIRARRSTAPIAEPPEPAPTETQ